MKLIKSFLFMMTFALIAALPTGAKAQKHANLGTCKLSSGESIKGCQVGYQILGTLNAAKDNVVIVPTYHTGTSADLVAFVSASKIVDPNRYYIVFIDALGNGVSSSPSNSTKQPRARFPQFNIADIVNASQRVVTETLGISHVYAVVGISMGGMQAFEWAVRYPDFMDRVVAIAGSARLAPSDVLVWRAEKHAIEESRAWQGGNYPAGTCVRGLADIVLATLTTPTFENTTAQADAPAVRETNECARFDLNDRLYQIRAMLAHDVAPGQPLKDVAARVHAKLLVVVARQDLLVNPSSALELAGLTHAQLIETPGPCGHLAPHVCELDTVAPAVRDFLR